MGASFSNARASAIRCLSLADLRANISLVSQDIILFNDSIRNNIAYGIRQDADEAAIIAAAQAASKMASVRNKSVNDKAVISGLRGSKAMLLCRAPMNCTANAVATIATALYQ